MTAARSKTRHHAIAAAGLRWRGQGPKQSHLQLQLYLHRFGLESRHSVVGHPL